MKSLLAYFEFPLAALLDRREDILVGVSWAPAGSQAAKTVSWKLEVGAEKAGSIVTDIDATVLSEDIACPAVAATYVRTGILIPASTVTDADVDELHCKLTRIAASADPAAAPGLHHIYVRQTLDLSGAQ